MKKLISTILIFIFLALPVYAGTNTHSIDLEQGSSQYLSITDASQTGLDLASTFSIELWTKPETIGVNNPLVNKSNDSGSPTHYGYELILGSDNKVRLRVSKDGTSSAGQFGSYATTDAVYSSAGTWKHIAITCTVGNTPIVYIDGSSVSMTVEASITSGSVENNEEIFKIGYSVPYGRTYDGLIDEVRVWSDVRTSGEISDNYQTELNGDEAGLVGYWKLNNSILDETSNGNDLTNNNSAVFSTDVPFAGGASDTCTYGGTGNWDVLESDNCYISSDVYVNGSLNIIGSSTGAFNCNASISFNDLNLGTSQTTINYGPSCLFNNRN